MRKLLAALALLASTVCAQSTCTGVAPGSCVSQDDGAPKSTPTLGSTGGNAGSLTMWGSTNGYATVQPTAAAGNVIVTLPATTSTLATTANIATALPSIPATSLYGGTAGAGVAAGFTMGVGLLGNTAGTAAPATLTTLPTGLTAPSLTVTTGFTATGLVTNAFLAFSVNVTAAPCTR